MLVVKCVVWDICWLFLFCHCILTCRQNESSVELLLDEPSYIYEHEPSTCIWCALCCLCIVWLYCFFWKHWLWNAQTYDIPCTSAFLPDMWTLPGELCCHILNTDCSCQRMAACLKVVGSDPLIFWPCERSFLHCGLVLPQVNLAGYFFLLCLCWGNSVLWCHRRLIWAAWGSPDTCFMCRAIAFELSSFFANCRTLLTGNFSRSMLPSLMVLDMNSSSQRKNQNISLCSILAVSGGYFAKFTCACTALYHSSMLRFPWQKLVSRSNLALTSLDCGLQYSSYFPHMMSRVNSLEERFQDTYWSMLQLLLQAITFLHFCHSGRAASSHSNMFSHLRGHFKKWWYKSLLTVQSIRGPSI